ncbi:NADH oxidase [Altererythrobacter sp. ZODW24]|uniref:alcohol dehydrogenase catalytic domain-containing protein n=1 Tax=Altererythrobacter sp. ZODW24 TaxID=2185142 RepID=UPI000DF80B67|nr:NADH oxidase [Altererythrobacter sp. ZODW24]
MTTAVRRILSTLGSDDTITVEVADHELPDPTGHQVLVKVEAAPINPSDLGLLMPGADLENADYSPGKLVAKMPPGSSKRMAGRVGTAMPAGNEGAGTVIAAGEDAQNMIGQKVACVTGELFATHVMADARMCMPLGDLTAEQGASAFVNPMTALGFVETARREGQKAIIHSAAASNLGQMLNKICQEDGFDLINIVRKQEQADILKGLGAKYIVNSSDDDFMVQLMAAIEETGAYIGFDPIFGGTMVNTIFTAMEAVAVKTQEYSRYGSTQQKRMYVYGVLNVAPMSLMPGYGFAWDLSGWLLTPFLASAGQEGVQKMQHRVLSNITTTFASSYVAKIDLDEMLTKEAAMAYDAKATGEKYLVVP